MVTLTADDRRAKVSVARAAELLGVSQGRVRSFITEGRLKGGQFDGRSWYVCCRSLVLFARLKRRPGNPEFLSG